MKSNLVRAGGHLVFAASLVVLAAATGCAEDRAADETSLEATQEATKEATQEAIKESADVITEGRKVSIEYTLKLADGTAVDSNVGKDPLVYTQGSGQILPALEGALAGLGVDDTKNVKLSAADGYGEINPDAYRDVEPKQVPEQARKVGALLTAGGPAADPSARSARRQDSSRFQPSLGRGGLELRRQDCRGRVAAFAITPRPRVRGEARRY